ncbi:MAG: glycosyltransferase family 2 protein [Lachnospiraceae bacterium]|nr:glycosyltransferase family 2 protein [Lachnospiraceae bacterium]
MVDDRIQISVIMCVRCRETVDNLIFAMDSILYQTYTDFEFIICDDDSDASAKELLSAYCRQDSRIRLLHNDQNRGVAYSLNRCIEVSCGKYIARMDADDISMSNRLQEEYEFLENHPEYSFVGCNAELIALSTAWGIRIMPEHPEHKDFLPYSPYIHPSVMGRRELFIHDGGYKVSGITWRCEDYEFFMRQHSQGYQGYNMQKPLYYYREDQNAYRRRRFRYSLAEMLIRIQGYMRLGLMLKGGIIYCFKPLVIGILPKRFYAAWKRRSQSQAQVSSYMQSMSEKISA